MTTFARQIRDLYSRAERALSKELAWLSPSYLSDLELGKRGVDYWNQDRLDTAIDATKHYQARKRKRATRQS